VSTAIRRTWPHLDLAGHLAAAAALAHDTGPTFRRWLRCQDLMAFRPAGHTPSSRAYLARIGEQLAEERRVHDALCGRASRLLQCAEDERERLFALECP
jgi:hypothetical protein